MKKGDNIHVHTVTKGKPKLTRKQAAFVKELITNPKQSATQATLKTYDTTDYMTAAAIASENLKKPQIISHLNDYNTIVEETISNTVIEYKNSDDIRQRTLAIDTAKWIHDKTHGKATQRTENTNLNINIEALLNNLV